MNKHGKWQNVYAYDGMIYYTHLTVYEIPKGKFRFTVSFPDSSEVRLQVDGLYVHCFQNNFTNDFNYSGNLAMVRRQEFTFTLEQLADGNGIIFRLKRDDYFMYAFAGHFCGRSDGHSAFRFLPVY